MEAGEHKHRKRKWMESLSSRAANTVPATTSSSPGMTLCPVWCLAGSSQLLVCPRTPLELCCAIPSACWSHSCLVVPVVLPPVLGCPVSGLPAVPGESPGALVCALEEEVGTGPLIYPQDRHLCAQTPSPIRILSVQTLSPGMTSALEREGHGSSPCSLWLILTLPVSAVAAGASDNQSGDERRSLAALSPVAGNWAGTASEGQESSVVGQLLQNSLDKAYGKQGNPGSPGWANSHAAPLP